MNIYLAMQSFPFEDTVVLGVYETFKEAVQQAQKVADGTDYEEYFVHRWVVGGSLTGDYRVYPSGKVSTLWEAPTTTLELI